MNPRKALGVATAAILLHSAAAAAKPSVEIASQARPNGTAPQQWLQRLNEAGAGHTRIVSRGGDPRIEDLGETRAPGTPW